MSDIKVTPELKEAFLEMLVNIPNITAVCRLFSVSPGTIRNHRLKDSEWDDAIREAIDDGYSMWEEEARRRAIDGVLEPVFYKGEQVGNVRKYSDSLLQTILKARLAAYKTKVDIGADEGKKVTLTFNIDGGE